MRDDPSFMVDLATGRGAASLLRHKFSSLTARFHQNVDFFFQLPSAQHSCPWLICLELAHAVSFCQDEALHGCTQLLNFLGSFVLLGVLLSNLALLESSARPAVHLLRQRLQVLNLFSSLPSNHPTISLSGSSRSWISTGQTIQRGQLMHLAR